MSQNDTHPRDHDPEDRGQRGRDRSRDAQRAPNEQPSQSQDIDDLIGNRPDPSETQRLSSDELGYDHDEEGNLLPVERTIKWNGQWRSVKKYPFTNDEERFLIRMQDQDELELSDFDEIHSILSKSMIEPGPDVLDSMQLFEELTFAIKLMEASIQGGASSISEDLNDEIAERQDATNAGN